MRWEVLGERFALIGIDGPPVSADLELLGREPAQMLREGGETTLLVAMASLQEVLARHPGARCERDLAWIRFKAPMGWQVVGFLARVTGALAAEGVPLGAVCGFSRDHLFLAERHLERAAAVLERLFGPADR